MANTDTKAAEKPLPEGIPNRFVFVRRADEEVKKTRVVEGQLLVCQGCCCGKTERGMPALPLDDFKQQWKELRLHQIERIVRARTAGPGGPARGGKEWMTV
jgi:hypothetical protein